MTNRSRTMLSSVLASSALFLAMQVPVAVAMPYTFDANNLGWSEADISKPSGGSETVTFSLGGAAWASETGNGYIQTSSTSASTPRAYNLGIFGSSASLLGDLTGRSVQTDFRRVGEFATLAGSAPTVRMVISDATTTTYGYAEATWYYSSVLTAPQLNAIALDWETYEFDLDASNFFVWPNGKGGSVAGGTAREFSNMLANYSFLGFTILSSAGDGSTYGYTGTNLPDYGARSTSTSGQESQFHVDNLRSVPEPGTLALLGAVAAGWFVSRRRRA